MNDAQVRGMRQMASVLNQPPLSAKEMANRPHTLSDCGDFATMPDGSVWIWDRRFEHWARWK